MFLAFLVSLTAFPLTNGLLPVVARDVYTSDENGLARMVAIFAGGALAGSITMAALGIGLLSRKIDSSRQLTD